MAAVRLYLLCYIFHIINCYVYWDIFCMIDMMYYILSHVSGYILSLKTLVLYIYPSSGIVQYN
jgi:hypothetical protein